MSIESRNGLTSLSDDVGTYVWYITEDRIVLQFSSLLVSIESRNGLTSLSDDVGTYVWYITEDRIVLQFLSLLISIESRNGLTSFFHYVGTYICTAYLTEANNRDVSVTVLDTVGE